MVRLTLMLFNVILSHSIDGDNTMYSTLVVIIILNRLKNQSCCLWVKIDDFIITLTDFFVFF